MGRSRLLMFRLSSPLFLTLRCATTVLLSWVELALVCESAEWSRGFGRAFRVGIHKVMSGEMEYGSQALCGAVVLFHDYLTYYLSHLCVIFTKIFALMICGR